MVVSTTKGDVVRYQLMKEVIENTYPDVRVVRGSERVSGPANLFIVGPGGAGETALSNDLVKELYAAKRNGEEISINDICDHQYDTVVAAYGTRQVKKVVQKVYITEQVPVPVPVAVPVYAQRVKPVGYYADPYAAPAVYEADYQVPAVQSVNSDYGYGNSYQTDSLAVRIAFDDRGRRFRDYGDRNQNGDRNLNNRDRNRNRDRFQNPGDRNRDRQPRDRRGNDQFRERNRGGDRNGRDLRGGQHQERSGRSRSNVQPRNSNHGNRGQRM